jgi:outer membrane autotransporter protein
MNNNYRIVWSDARQAFIVTHEAAGSHGRPSSTQLHVVQAIASMVLACSASQALALCPTAVSSTITVSTAVNASCSLNTGESIVITSPGSITSSTAIDVNGTTANTIQNAGTLNGTGDTSIHILNSGIVSSLTNTGTIHGLSYGVLIDNGTITAALINNGMIDPGYSGITIQNGAVVGSLTNTGTISVSNIGIYVNSGTVSGGVHNSGTISGAEHGMYFSGAEVQGGIVNSGHISGPSTGLVVRSSSTITGGITNSGTIDINAPSYDRSVIDIVNSTVSGDIVNSGLLNMVGGSEHAFGFSLRSSTLNGSISNSGTIHTIVPNTSSAYGMQLDGATITGGLTNTGLIQGGVGGTDTGYGAYISVTSIAGAIVNSGTITGQGSSHGYGLYLSGSTITGGIINSSHIDGTDRGIYVGSSTISGDGIVNQAGGTIMGGQQGIEVDGSSVVSGITNSGLITGTSQALKLDNAADGFTVANSGTLQGDVELGINTLDLNGTSSRVTGATTGTGTVNVNGTFTSENTFDVGAFNIATNGVFNIANGVTVGGGGFHNAGVLNVGATTQTITGDYTQAAGGVLRLSLSDATSAYGKLHVVGNATLASGAVVNVNVLGSPTIDNGTTVTGVLTTTGTLTATPANITVTDNSALYNFTAAEVSSPGSALDLVVAADRNGLPNAVIATNNPVALGAATALQQMRNTGVPEAMQPVFDRLNQMTPEEASNAVSQTLPALLGAGSQAGVNALHSMNKVIQSRVESSHGLSSGDEIRDRYMWVRGFGNLAKQQDRDGVSGFESDTGGLVIGGDAPVSPRMRAGGAFTYAKSYVKGNSDAAPSKVEVDTYELVGYASYNIDPQTDINYQIDVGQNRAQSTRDIGFMGTQATADFSSLAVHGSVGVGRVMPMSAQTNLTPSVRLDYTHMRTDGYTEDGAGPLNLKVDAQTYREFLLTTDLKVAHQLEQGAKLVANGSVGYDFINKQAQTTAIFTGGGDAFVTDGLKVSPWFYRVGLGLIKENDKGTEVSIRYDMEGRTSGYVNQTVSAKVRWAF